MLVDIIAKYLESKKKNPKEHKDRLYPAHASCYVNFLRYKRLYGKCMRSAYYSCIGEEEKDSNTQNLKSMLGEYVERMIIDIFKRTSILKESAVSFGIDKFRIYGKADAIIEVDKEMYGVEIKSIGGNNQYLNNLIFINNCPKWQDLFQTIIYCYAFKDKLPNGFILIYIRRDTGEVKEFKIQLEPYNNQLVAIINGKPDLRYNVKDILDRYSLLYKYISENKIPPREYMEIYPVELIPEYYKAGILSKKQVDAYNIKPFGDQACTYCGYKHICNKEG